MQHGYDSDTKTSVSSTILTQDEAIANLLHRSDISLTQIRPPSSTSIKEEPTLNQTTTSPKLTVKPQDSILSPEALQRNSIESFVNKSLQLGHLSMLPSSATPPTIPPINPLQALAKVKVPPPHGVPLGVHLLQNSRSYQSLGPLTRMLPTGQHSVPVYNSVLQPNPPPRFIPFKCPLCSHFYPTQMFLNEHMRKEHSVLI